MVKRGIIDRINAQDLAAQWWTCEDNPRNDRLPHRHCRIRDEETDFEESNSEDEDITEELNFNHR